MKFYAVLIFVMLATVQTHAHERYKKGDTLYVWAIDGVKVRVKPQGEVIARLDYGTAVVVLQDDQGISDWREAIPPQKIGDKEYPGIDIVGKFVEVSVDTITGFVFDAYLLTLPPIKVKNRYGECEPYDEYFSRTFGILETLKKDLQPDNIDLKVRYNRGINYELQTTACCGTQSIVFPDMTMTEAFIFLNRIYDFEQSVKYAREAKSIFFKVVENKDTGSEQYLRLDFDLITIRIQRINNELIITRSGGD